MPIFGRRALTAAICCHRTARLSMGNCVDGQLVCGYHGWTYDRSGRVVNIPQLEKDGGTSRFGTPAYSAVEKYGYVWVALEEPLAPIFEVPEDVDPGYRRIHQFYDRWETSPLRLMENSFDSAHFSYVHRGTFGIGKQPKPSMFEINETDYGFYAETIVSVHNPAAAFRITATSEPMTTRHFRNHWYLPFCRRLDIGYPSGIRHIIITCATPIDDGSMQLVQFLYRNDTEADCPAEALNAWDGSVIAEDRAMLECLDPDATVNVALRREEHMPSDRPGIIMRKRLFALLQEHREEEIVRS
jgi:phenylpropionate dioxygenase-like ring-hydroxylating dioxygenase large terminal subunit